MKGHTKIELFNAKTGKLEKTVEDNNMFTNALNSLLNDNIGGDLSDPADIFPLPEKALGGLMLLPEAEEEDVNNLFPHSFPVATGVYGRTDISGNSMMGVYNADKSGYSPNKESYTHVWEFPTHQGNGTIACAALTHILGVDSVLDGSVLKPYNINKAICPFRNILLDDQLGCTYNGYVYFITCAGGEISDNIAPSFIIKRCKIIEGRFNKLSELPMNIVATDYTSSNVEIVATITLPLTYGDYVSYQSFESSEGKILLLVSGCEKGTYSTYYGTGVSYMMTKPFIDVYEINVVTQQVNFIRTLNVPIYDKNTGTAQITESGRDVRRYEQSSHSYGGSYDDHYRGTDYHLCAEFIGKHCSTNAAEALSKSDIIVGNQEGRVVYKNGYIFYNPLFYEPIDQVNNQPPGIWNLDLYVRINIFTNEFNLIQAGRGLVNYPIVQIYNDEAVYAIGNRVYNSDTNTLYYSTEEITGVHTNPTSSPASAKSSVYGSNTILSVHGIYGLYYWGKRYSYSHEIVRSRNNMYLATINNLPQPMTKSSEQTMRVTYTISNEV